MRLDNAYHVIRHVSASSVDTFLTAVHRETQSLAEKGNTNENDGGTEPFDPWAAAATARGLCAPTASRPRGTEDMRRGTEGTSVPENLPEAEEDLVSLREKFDAMQHQLEGALAKMRRTYDERLRAAESSIDALGEATERIEADASRIDVDRGGEIQSNMNDATSLNARLDAVERMLGGVALEDVLVAVRQAAGDQQSRVDTLVKAQRKLSEDVLAAFSTRVDSLEAQLRAVERVALARGPDDGTLAASVATLRHEVFRLAADVDELVLRSSGVPCAADEPTWAPQPRTGTDSPGTTLEEQAGETTFALLGTQDIIQARQTSRTAWWALFHAFEPPPRADVRPPRAALLEWASGSSPQERFDLTAYDSDFSDDSVQSAPYPASPEDLAQMGYPFSFDRPP